jgi:hypothetical protein
LVLGGFGIKGAVLVMESSTMLIPNP